MESRPAQLFDRIVHRGEDATDVFFETDDDAPDAGGVWTAVALPGSPTPFDDLRAGDLVVQRALGEGNLATLHVIGDDIGPQALYDQHGLIRPDMLVFREAVTSEDVPSVVGAPRRTASEWHRAAKAGFLGRLPERTRPGTGSEVLTALMLPATEPKDWRKHPTAKSARDEKILDEIVSGNIPRFLRQGTVVTVKFTGKDKKEHTIHYQVMREYLTVGNTRDHVIVPLIPATAQRIADKFGCILPTRKMVDQIFNAATVKLSALPRDYWMQGQTDKATGKKVPIYDPTKDKKSGHARLRRVPEKAGLPDLDSLVSRARSRDQAAVEERGGHRARQRHAARRRSQEGPGHRQGRQSRSASGLRVVQGREKT